MSDEGKTVGDLYQNMPDADDGKAMMAYFLKVRLAAKIEGAEAMKAATRSAFCDHCRDAPPVLDDNGDWVHGEDGIFCATPHEVHALDPRDVVEKM